MTAPSPPPAPPAETPPSTELPKALTLTPIGVVHSPFAEKHEAPRQSSVGEEVRGRIELHPGFGFEHALVDIDGFSHLWVLFWFHLNANWRPKVQPPRGGKRRGVFATRSPHRPNPLGMSVVRLERREGLVLHVSGLDILDGTPVLDLKPYVAYSDALLETESGWLRSAPDPIDSYLVVFAPRAAQQLSFLARSGVLLEATLRQVLETGPEEHAYRRIKRQGDGYVLAVKAWRAHFHVNDKTVTVEQVVSGYRPRELAQGTDPELELHRALAALDLERA